MKKALRRTAIAAAFAGCAGLLAFFYFTRLTAAQRSFAQTLQVVDAIADPAVGHGRTLSATLEVLRAKGLPDALGGARLDVRFAAPDRLRLSTRVGDGNLELGRDGNEIWAWQPAKNFGVRALRDVPLFAADPARLDDTGLAPLAIHLDGTQLALAPALFDVQALADEIVDGASCRALAVTPRPAARRWFGWSDSTLTLWLRDDGFPVRLGYRDASGRTDVLVALHDARIGAALPPETWASPAPAGANVARVALRHWRRFFAGVPQLLEKPKPSTLGPATGAREIVATSGKGRLELRDGTRVLFLRGTPEEMGLQHGTLLAPQVRDLVSRVLYGIGVGSSFGKGEWFFGTIERCQARIQPFVDPRYTREMDALADAAGLEREEVRLANFFPELFHCSGFALTGAATRDGRIYHGRILDYMKGVGLEPNAVVMVLQPDQGHAWVNISYAGFTGSVTAMNDQHLSIGEMGGRGEGHWDGKPMAQLVREVMEKAGTLDEAVAIMRDSPRTCEYYYVIADGKSRQAVGIKATHDSFEVIHPGEAHPQLATPVKDTVLMSAGDRYTELAKRALEGWGRFDADSARALMTRPVCMTSNIHSVLFAPDTLDLWVANADGANVASHTRYTRYNLAELLGRTTGDANATAAVSQPGRNQAPEKSASTKPE
jgi:isopenicillin-N N-acyltransferase like protein